MATVIGRVCCWCIRSDTLIYMKQTVCMYHGNCTDGTVSAAIMLKYHPNTAFFPLREGYVHEDILAANHALRNADNVYLLDYAKGIDHVLAVHDGTVTVIDHHVGQHTDAQNITKAQNGRVSYVYDESECGATLTWKYFFPHEQEPELLKYVKDTDIWHLAYGDTSDQINAYLSLYQNDPVRMLQKLSLSAEDVRDKGELIMEFRRMQLERDFTLSGHVAKCEQYNVLLYNVTQNAEVFGDKVAYAYKRVVGMYRIRGRDVSVLFRSVDGCEPTALAVAQQYGEGQHLHASSITIPLSDFFEMITHASVFEV